jgi:hypothetical protein
VVLGARKLLDCRLSRHEQGEELTVGKHQRSVITRRLAGPRRELPSIVFACGLDDEAD